MHLCFMLYICATSDSGRMEFIMFKINYEIMEPIEILQTYTPFDCHITGLFEMVANNKKYGLYDENLLICPACAVYLPGWFERLLRVVKKLKRNPYILLNDVESFGVWIEFIYKSNFIDISIINDVDFVDGQPDMLFHHMFCAKKAYGEWNAEKIGFEEFSYEVIKCSNEFLKRIYSINSSLKKNSVLREIEMHLLECGCQ